MEITSRYISCACNCVPHSLDWGINGLICYGACNSVAIYDPEEGSGGRVRSTLCAHKGRVNSVRWVRKLNSLPETQLVSGSKDSSVILWTLENAEISSNVLVGHENSVTVVDAHFISDSVIVIVSASVDSTIRVWEVESKHKVTCKDVINLNTGLALSVRLTLLPSRQWLLASGTDDCKIHLYTDNSDGVVKLDSLVGHEDWVRSLDFAVDDSGDLLLASGSQDATIRLWRFQSMREHKVDGAFKLEELILSVNKDLKLTVRLEALLSGHTGWIYGLHWHPTLLSETGAKSQPLQLLSASMDKTVVIWSPEEQSGVWLEKVRMGEVGGNSLGFYGGLFGPRGDVILTHGFQGGLHMWRRTENNWSPSVTVGGHFDAVTDIGWEVQHGRYLLSVSSDQTTRLHAPWSRENKKESWHELARPQVHGYDLVCLAVMPNYRFASGADEKVVRAFVAPQNFLKNFNKLCAKDSSETVIDKTNLPQGAAVPVLGLSNKAVYENENICVNEEKAVKDQYDVAYFVPQQLTEPPTEDNLMQNTLWPEVMKLYGHGYEIYSLACTSDGKLLASACKATTAQHAAILLWDTGSWQNVGKLASHQLTITQMAFSPNDQFLLSVSRDRRWSLFEKQNGTSAVKYKLTASTDKATCIHTRIIWCCAWTHDSNFFATASREGRVVVWGRDQGNWAANKEQLDTGGVSVTALSFAHFLVQDEYLCAVGMDSGTIELYGWGTSRGWRKLYHLDVNNAHHLTVKRLAFRPSQDRNNIQLASCGNDHLVKVYDVHLNKA